MRGDEVLDRRKAFLVRLGDREFHDGTGYGGDETLHTGHLGDLADGTAGAGLHHVGDGAVDRECRRDELLDFGFGTVPDLDVHAIAFLVGEQTFFPVVADVVGTGLRRGDECVLLGRHADVVDGPGDAGLRHVAEAEALDAVHDVRDAVEAVAGDEVIDDAGHLFVVDAGVNVWVVRREDGVEEEATDGRLEHLSAELRVLLFRGREDFDLRLEAHCAVVIREDRGVRGGECFTFAECAFDILGHPIGAEENVEHLGRDDRLAVARLEDVLVGGHDLAGFRLRFRRERHVHGHLVAVEVGVEGRTHERVELDGVTFHERRLECLNAEAVQRRRAVKHNVLVFDDLFENRPHFRYTFIDETAGAADVEREFLREELADDERAEEFQRHVLRQAALVELEVRADDDHGAGGVVHALAEEVLTEETMLTLEVVGE